MTEKRSPIVVGQEHLPWDNSKAIIALRSIGYTFEQAIADIIDNCIDAKAKNVLVRFTIKANGALALSIVDDGRGMNARILKEAMRVGSGTDPKREHLGKYGLGLKLATFSHAKSLTVHTRRDNEVNGRRMTVAGIQAGGKCDLLAKEESEKVLEIYREAINLNRHGTIVTWDQIDRITYESSNLERLIKKLRKKLQLHLGMCFHRQLSNGDLRISHDRQNVGGRPNNMAISVTPLDPFRYNKSGHKKFPKMIVVKLPTIGRLEAEAHIWPPKSKQPEYKLDGASARQGFYFYRNDRLIQAGGWNGWRETQDPHLSLARIRIDLPPRLDSHFSLDVKKCGINTPAVFPISLQSAEFSDETRFDDYLKAADGVYRKRSGVTETDFPLVPSQGIPQSLRKAFKKSVAEGRHREITLRWRKLPRDRFFDIDRDEETLYINSRYRNDVLRGSKGSKNDAPLIKTLLFLLLQDEFDTQRLTKKRKAELESINQVLIAAVNCLDSSNDSE